MKYVHSNPYNIYIVQGESVAFFSSVTGGFCKNLKKIKLG